MAPTTRPHTALWGLPDPDSQRDFYEGVPSRRLAAFLADSVVIGLIVLAIVAFTAFTAAFFLPFLILATSFLYRVLTVAQGSATWGMRLAGIELRNHRGEKFDLWMAGAHTFLFLAFLGMVLPLILSVALMLTTSRGQGLHDLLLGSAAIRRPA